MKCETCFTRDFVHADLYCRGCNDKPDPRTRTGIAYFFRKDKSEPALSTEIKAPVGLEYEVAAVKFLQKHRFEFVEG